MDISLKYGKIIKNFNLPTNVEKLVVSEPEFGIRKEEFYASFSECLPVEAGRYLNVGIIISDKTRLCGYPLYLPWIIDILMERGATRDNITFYIAYGTHPKQTEEESLSSYGDTYKSFRFVHHSSSDEQIFANLGTTRRGTPVKVRKDVLESSLVITFGAISHHYFAGYGGGRKLFFPGLAERRAIYHNHGLFLDRKKRRLSEGCQPGKLDGNPLAEDLNEINSLMPQRISVHGILNTRGEVCELLVGKDYDGFLSACKVHDSYYRSKNSNQFDLVIASSGGYPKDINFIQAHKSVHHAAAFVKDGGKLIMLSECFDGIASNYFLKYLESGNFENAFSMLENNYEGNGGTALSMMSKTNRIKIYMMTSLSTDICKTLNVTQINDKEIQQLLDSEKGSIACIQNSSMLVK
jgi:nickel-dependent lactate racemase